MLQETDEHVLNVFLGVHNTGPRKPLCRSSGSFASKRFASEMLCALLEIACGDLSVVLFLQAHAVHCKSPLNNASGNAPNSQLSYTLKIDIQQTSLGLLFFALQQNKWNIHSKLIKNCFNMVSKSIQKQGKTKVEGLWKGSRRPSGSWKRPEASGRRKPWLVHPPWDSPLGFL